MKKPKCRLCGAEHWASEPHKFGPTAGAVPVEPEAPKPKLTDGRAKVVAGLREAVEIASGRADPARVTIICRDKAKHAASMRAWRAKRRETASADG